VILEANSTTHASYKPQKLDSMTQIEMLKKYYGTDTRDTSDTHTLCEVSAVTATVKPVGKGAEVACNYCRQGSDCKNSKSDSRSDSPFIILSCNHIFHVKCLTRMHLDDIYKFPVIDGEYFDKCKCLECDGSLQTEELMFLHSKFLSTTKDHIATHQKNIQTLEDRLKEIKEELKVCYDYKHKLEGDREKSKQIVGILSTMM
jgi:hypothetical protein